MTFRMSRTPSNLSGRDSDEIERQASRTVRHTFDVEEPDSDDDNKRHLLGDGMVKTSRWLNLRPRDILRSRLSVALFIAGGVLCLVLVFVLAELARAPEIDVLQFIDPLIGTGPGGHVFAGATLPFGMAKAVADISGEKMGGFASDRSNVTGFSHLHDSGTGGSPSLGNFPIFLLPSCKDGSIEKCAFSSYYRKVAYVPESVRASPGYFGIELANGVKAEMTVSEKAALYKFSFTHTDNSTTFLPTLLADTSDLPGSSGMRYMKIDPQTGRMMGNGTFTPSFGRGMYSAHVCVDVKNLQIESSGTFDYAPKPGQTEITGGSAVGAYLRLKNIKPTDEILVRVGLSFLNMDRACENAESEIPDWDFQRLLENARMVWRNKLAPIKLSGKNIDRQHYRNYWSGVYRAFISPQDYTGENPLWNSTEPYYDSWYCIWDTFRGVHPFYNLIDPVSQSRMVRSLIDIFKHVGWLPDCRMSFCKGFTQGGSNADVVLVDSFIKGLPGVDWDQAYQAIIKDAEVQPDDWDMEGRGGLKAWKEIGYIPFGDYSPGGMNTRTISRTSEYAHNDFSIALMANATGRHDDYVKYSKRASNWKNLYKADYESMGFSGFLQPRKKDGTWGQQNATLCSPIDHPNNCFLDYNGHETYEGSPWLYTFYVPHDMAGLIETMGGRKAFLSRLETLHDSGVLYMGDEQAFLTAFLYHYAGRPGLSSKRTHMYIPSMFNDTVAGIPGNDDSGAMGSFVFFSMLGIFPNAGQSVYFIIPPYFEKVEITNPITKKVATIRNVNFDADYKRIYIQSARLNGKKYSKNWIDHSFFTEGKTLELVLGEKESEWGTKEEDVPPSLSTGLFVGQ